MTLHQVKPLCEQPGMADAMARCIADMEGTVCEVCGLGMVGHQPESRWLGYGKHSYTPRDASEDDKRRARELTREAYRIRNATQYVAKTWTRKSFQSERDATQSRDRDVKRGKECTPIVHTPGDQFPYAYRVMFEMYKYTLD